MDKDTQVALIQEGGKLLGRIIESAVSQPRVAPHEAPAASSRTAPRVATANSEETTRELRRRLAKELYRMELDLDAGLRIAGKPCDCGSNKHTLMLEAAAEELISQDPSNARAYQDIIAWIPANAHKIHPEAIESGQYTEEYPFMANQFKLFRKRVLGTSEDSPAIAPATITPGPMTLEAAKRLAAEEAIKEVERAWDKEGKDE